MRHLLFILAIILYGFLHAQRIEPGATMADGIGGTDLIEFTDTTEICGLVGDDNWLQTNALLFVRPTDFADGVLVKGSLLYNNELEACAKALVNIQTEGDTLIDKRKLRDYRKVHIRGIVHKNRFLDGSIPELTYEEILQTKSRSEQDEKLQRMLNESGFEQEEEGDLEFFVKRKTACSLEYAEEEAPFRFIIITRGGRPYCVVTNGARFRAPKLKEEKEEGDYRFYYFQKSREDVHETIRTLMYSYVPL